MGSPSEVKQQERVSQQAKENTKPLSPVNPIDEDLKLHKMSLLAPPGSIAVFSESESEYSEEDTIPKLHGHKKTVSFSSLEVREYVVVVGDHPCCSMGLPLSLGWEFEEADTIPLDRYEATREPRRSRQELRTTCEERREILSLDLGELRRAERQLHRARSCQARLCERMNAQFFD